MFGWAAFVSADVLERNGNLYLLQGQQETQLTSSGSDHEPALSNKGDKVVFVREVKHGSDEIDVSRSIYMLNLNDKSVAELFHEAGQYLEDPLFSLDDKKIYFASGGETLGSFHIMAYELAKKKARLFCDGLNAQLVRKGKYAGHLVVQKHKYFLASGSYDYFWLVNSQGKEVTSQPVGNENQTPIELRQALEEDFP